MSNLTMVEALNLAMSQEMSRDENVCLMGEDIGINGGVFRVTKDLQKQYGDNRVMDTPLAECGIVGAAVGMAIYGIRPVVEIQFSGFTMQAFDQIEFLEHEADAAAKGACTARRVAKICPEDTCGPGEWTDKAVNYA